MQVGHRNAGSQLQHNQAAASAMQGGAAACSGEAVPCAVQQRRLMMLAARSQNNYRRERESHQGVVGVGGGQRGRRLRGELIQLRSGDALVHTGGHLLGHQNLWYYKERRVERSTGSGARQPGAGAGHPFKPSFKNQRALRGPRPLSRRLKRMAKLWGPGSGSARRRSAHRVAEVRVEAIRELGDAGRDLVKMHGLLAPIPLNYVLHGRTRGRRRWQRCAAGG